ncbi:hypothetical protein HDU91_005185 [Kappamyces sp. JEL0680]|nr:hypothetical protein HDU91_005185 [Kappamyces sp. JEL0680]
MTRLLWLLALSLRSASGEIDFGSSFQGPDSLPAWFKGSASTSGGQTTGINDPTSNPMSLPHGSPANNPAGDPTGDNPTGPANNPLGQPDATPKPKFPFPPASDDLDPLLDPDAHHFSFELFDAEQDLAPKSDQTASTNETYHTVSYDFASDAFSFQDLSFLNNAEMFNETSRLSKRDSTISQLCSVGKSVCSSKFSVPDAIEPKMCSTDIFKVVPCKTKSTIHYPCGVSCNWRRCKVKTCSRDVCVPGTEAVKISTLCAVTVRWKVVNTCDLAGSGLSRMMDLTERYCKCTQKLGEFVSNGFEKALNDPDNASDQVVVAAVKAAADMETCFIDSILEPTTNRDAVVKSIQDKYEVVKWAPIIDTSMYLQFLGNAVVCAVGDDCTPILTFFLNYINSVKSATIGDLGDITHVLTLFFGNIKDSFSRIVANLNDPSWSPFSDIGTCLVSKYLFPLSKVVDPMCCPDSLIPSGIQEIKNEMATLDALLTQYTTAVNALKSLGRSSFSSDQDYQAIQVLTGDVVTNLAQAVKSVKQEFQTVAGVYEEVPQLMSTAFDKVLTLDTVFHSVTAKLDDIQQGIVAVNDLLNGGLVDAISSFSKDLQVLVDLAKTDFTLKGLIEQFFKKGPMMRPGDIFGVLFGKGSLQTSIKKIQDSFKTFNDAKKITEIASLVDELRGLDLQADVQTISGSFAKLVKDGKALLDLKLSTSETKIVSQFLDGNQQAINNAVSMAAGAPYHNISNSIRVVADAPVLAKKSFDNMSNNLNAKVKDYVSSVTNTFKDTATELTHDFSTLPNVAKNLAACDPVLDGILTYSQALIRNIQKWNPSKIRINGGAVSISRSAKIRFDWLCSKMGRQTIKAFGYDVSFDAPEFWTCQYENRIPLPNHHLPYLGISLGLVPTVDVYPSNLVPENSNVSDDDYEEITDDESSSLNLRKRDSSTGGLADTLLAKKDQCSNGNSRTYGDITVPCLSPFDPVNTADYADPYNTGTCLMNVSSIMTKEVIPGVAFSRVASEGTTLARLDVDLIECARQVRLVYPKVAVKSIYRSVKHNDEIYEKKRNKWRHDHPGVPDPKEWGKGLKTTVSRHSSGAAIDLLNPDATDENKTIDFIKSVLDICYRKSGMDHMGVGIYVSRSGLTL